MSARLEIADRRDAELLVEALLEHADRCRRTLDLLRAKRVQTLADELGTALDDGLPVPTGYGPGYPDQLPEQAAPSRAREEALLRALNAERRRNGLAPLGATA